MVIQALQRKRKPEKKRKREKKEGTKCLKRK
jgi:hypothetical protein